MASNRARSSSIPPERESDPTTTEGDGSSSEDGGFDNPLHGAADLGEPDVIEQPGAGCADSARLGAQLIDFGVTLRFSAPLTDAETAELRADLESVLVKYDTPNIPFAEEVRLACTVGGIVFRRAAAEAAQRRDDDVTQTKPPEPKETVVDSASAWQEGHRQNSVDQKVSGPRPGSECADLLS